MDPRVLEVEKDYRRDDLPAFDPGDTVRVRVRVTEGDKERIQAFEGICIARSGAGINETFTVRKVSGGVGVERIFPVHAPSLAGIEVVRRGSVRRAKLYYLRQRRGKKARVREKAWWLNQETGGRGAVSASASSSSAAPGPGSSTAGASSATAPPEPSEEAASPPSGEEAGGGA